MSNESIRSILGTNEMGKRASQHDSENMLKLFKEYGFTELDSAHLYGDGKTEEVIGKFKDQQFTVATKANPLNGKTLKPESLRMQLETSLKRLNRPCVDIFYLHWPDHNTPLVDTLREVNKLHTENKFMEFGLSNYASWLVAEVCNICKQNNWIKPTVYQGMYSAITRKVEAELFPCLRYYGIRFYAYSPLGGGMLTGKHKMIDADKQEPGRFFGNKIAQMLYRNRYWKQEYFDGIEKLRRVLNEVYGESTVSVPEAAFRWLYHHSFLDSEHADAVIIGAATPEQLKVNLIFLSKKELDDKVVEVFNNLWKETMHVCAEYAY